MIGQELAEYIHNLSYGDLPQRVVHQAKRLILDTIGTILLGSGEAGGDIAKFIDKVDGKPESTIVCLDRKASCAYAAFANASFAQVHDFNDGHRGTEISLLSNSPCWGGCYHPGRIVIPTALSVGEKLSLSGEEFITAIVIGYDVAARIMGVKHKPPSEVYCTAAVASRMMGLSVTRILGALGIAGFMSPGKLGSGPSFAADYLVHGYFAKNGIEAAMLAAEGFTGPQLYDDSLLSTRFYEKGLGKDFEIMKGYIKPYPTCRMTHGATDAIFQLRAEMNLDYRNIQEVIIHQLTSGMYVTEGIISENSYYKNCEYNIFYTTACALMDGEVSVKQFRKERIADPCLHKLMKKIRVIPDESLDACYPENGRPAIVEIRTNDGNRYTKRIDFPRGDVRNPLTDEEILDKFIDCAQCYGKKDAILALKDAIYRIDRMRNISELTGLLSRAGE